MDKWRLSFGSLWNSKQKIIAATFEWRETVLIGQLLERKCKWSFHSCHILANFCRTCLWPRDSRIHFCFLFNPTRSLETKTKNSIGWEFLVAIVIRRSRVSWHLELAGSRESLSVRSSLTLTRTGQTGTKSNFEKKREQEQQQQHQKKLFDFSFITGTRGIYSKTSERVPHNWVILSSNQFNSLDWNNRR